MDIHKKDDIKNMHLKVEVPLTIKILDTKDDFFRFEALGSTFGNVDLVDDVMVKGCFSASLAKQTPVILWQHDRDEPIGIPEFIAETDKGLHLTVIMPKDDDFVSGRVMPQLRIGSVKSMSIGFIVDEFRMEDGIRFITKCTLKEVSLVTFPANPDAVVTSVKSFEAFQGQLDFAARSHAWCSANAEERVKSATGSIDQLSMSYKNNFLWFDDEKPTDENAYKLLFVDIIEGNRKVVPRALFAARAALQGTRGGVTIPESDKLKVSALIDKYLERLDEVEPIKMLEPCDLKDMSKRDFENALRESGTFSKSASVMIASSFPYSGEPPRDDDDAIIKTANEILLKEEEAVIVNLLEDILGGHSCLKKTKLSNY